MTKTMRKVTIVVAVFITSCHVSLKRKMGPVVIHAAIRPSARAKVIERPLTRATHLAKREYHAMRLICAPPIFTSDHAFPFFQRCSWYFRKTGVRVDLENCGTPPARG